MGLQVGYPERMLDDAYMLNLYKKMTVQKNDFYRNIMYGAYYRRMVEQSALQGGNTGDAVDFNWRHALLADGPTYLFQNNLLGSYLTQRVQCKIPSGCLTYLIAKTQKWDFSC